MGNIDWIKISELPEAFKDGRELLLYGRCERDGAFYGRDVNVGWWDRDHWRARDLPIEPTHFAEINLPGEQDPGIPMYKMSTDD